MRQYLAQYKGWFVVVNAQADALRALLDRDLGCARQAGDQHRPPLQTSLTITGTGYQVHQVAVRQETIRLAAGGKKMDKIMPCGLDDSRLWDQADANEASRQQRVEDYADYLMDECKNAARADEINRDYDMYDGFLLSFMMEAVARWSGRSDDAAEQMRKLHNLLADALQEIAEREVK